MLLVPPAPVEDFELFVEDVLLIVLVLLLMLLLLLADD